MPVNFLSHIGLVGTVWLGENYDFTASHSLMSMTALGLLIGTSPSQNANVNCFSPTDGLLEVTSCRYLS